MLLRLSEEAGVSSDRRKLKITQREISQMLGTTRESVNKQLRAWAKRKWIALQRGEIVVLAPALQPRPSTTPCAAETGRARPSARGAITPSLRDHRNDAGLRKLPCRSVERQELFDQFEHL